MLVLHFGNVDHFMNFVQISLVMSIFYYVIFQYFYIQQDVYKRSPKCYLIDGKHQACKVSIFEQSTYNNFQKSYILINFVFAAVIITVFAVFYIYHPCYKHIKTRYNHIHKTLRYSTKSEIQPGMVKTQNYFKELIN